MEKPPTTILDVSKGLGYGFLYAPIIGNSRSKKIFPFTYRFSSLRVRKEKKRL